MGYFVDGWNAARTREKLETPDKTAILDYDDFMLASGTGEIRRCCVIGHLKRWRALLGKPFKDANRKDIIAAVGKLEQDEKPEGGKYASSTKAVLKFTLKAFYRWLRGAEDFPPEVSWIKGGVVCGAPKLPKDMLTEDDIKKLVGAAACLRDKALIMVLWETGMRASELRSLQWDNISFMDKESAVLVFTCGKSKGMGQRRNPLRAAVPLLNALRNDSPSSPHVWVANGGKRISRTRLREILRDAAKAAGITKPVHPHNFRHSRATYLQTRLHDSVFRKFLGWSASSRMPSTYTHMSEQTLDDGINALYGLKPPERALESALGPKKCERCGETNTATLDYCSRCGFALTMEAALKWHQDEEAKLQGMLEELVVRKLREFKAQQSRGRS